MTTVRLQHISKQFDATRALADTNLTINSGELFFLLGPSGCGKSTLLRLIAGLLEPTSGQIFFNDRDVTNLDTEHRNAVMCFQSYALWPHMTVAQNIAFGLEVRKLQANQIRQRADEVLKLVQMDKYADRKPNQLSGGQQQRVALARALAVKPDCLLLDEPLSNLDAQLRQEMRTEIRRICKSTGVTTIYVTHDQKEALSIADRIALLKDGKLLQVGTPGELYHSPASSFVATFIGQANLIPARILETNADHVTLDTPLGHLLAATTPSSPFSRGPSGRASSDSTALISIRPEQIRLAAPQQKNTNNHLTVQLLDSTFLGESSEHTLQINNQKLRMIATPPLLSPPPQISIEINPRDVVILPPNQ